jgi:hypothetical protein
MSKTDQEFRALVLLSLQRALLGMVTADLRAVQVELTDRAVEGRFIYDGDITSEHDELVDEVETLLIADLDDDMAVRLHAVSVPAIGSVLPVSGVTYCYLRREI